MAMTSTNFISYNSTGLDTVKTSWIRDLMKTCDASFFQLQEHFKATKTVNKFFKNEFPDSDSYVIPGHREINQDKGRAKAGLAQISRKCLDIRKERLSTKSFRLQAQILNFGTYKLLWINAYFPTDPRTINYDDTDLLQVQTEIENILENSDCDDVILGGDFNYDKTRPSGFAASMTRFIEKIQLHSVWDKFPIDFTHIHTDLKSTAILDNFFVSEGFLSFVEDAGVLHLGDNLSRHSPSC
jgi:exonuclease III